jgi:hypothetical protein
LTGRNLKEGGIGGSDDRHCKTRGAKADSERFRDACHSRSTGGLPHPPLGLILLSRTATRGSARAGDAGAPGARRSLTDGDLKPLPIPTILTDMTASSTIKICIV